MRIYFGRYPDKANHVEVKNIDHFFLNFLMDADYDFDLAVSNLIKSFDKTTTYYTCNPLIINFFEDYYAKEFVYLIDADGKEYHMGTDVHMLKKFKFMGPGDIVCDDYRSFK